MNKEKLQNCINEGATQRELAAIFGKSQTTIRYWLKKHNLLTANEQKPRQVAPECACGEVRPNQFYGHKNTVCKKCHNDYVIRRANETREFVLKHFSNKCLRCGYDEFKSGLTLHHLDPNKKDSNYASMRTWGRDRVIREISGCILLCACCHNGLHAEEWDITEIKNKIPAGA